MSEIIYGIHAVKALLERDPQRFLEVFILKGREDRRLQPLIAELEATGIVIQVASRQWLDDKVEGAVHQGIIARVREGRQYQENDLPGLLESVETPFLLVLDGVTDPHNLGACLRSADAAGVHAVIVPRDRSAQLNATAKKVACGAAESVPLIRVTNLARNAAPAAGNERLGGGYRRRSRPYAVSEQNDRPDGAGDGRGRRRHASSDPRTLRRADQHPDGRYRLFAERVGRHRHLPVRSGASARLILLTGP